MRIVIIGCGRTGAGLAMQMARRGDSVTVVDRDPAAFDRLEPHFNGVVISGEGFDREVLLGSGIKRADALAAVTDNDEVNIVVARLARSFFHVPRVVARLHDPRKAEIYRRLGLQVVSHVTWGINRIGELLCHSHLNVVLSLGNGEVEIVEVEIPELLVGRTVMELTVPGEVEVVTVSRKGKPFLPAQRTVFEKGDTVNIAVASASVDRLTALLALT